MSPALALRTAVRQALLTDANLSELLGSGAVHDEVPADASPPYVVLGDHASRDRSAGEAPAEEHELALQVWSTQGGLKQTLEIAEAIVSCLLTQDLTPVGHRVANIGWLSTDARRSEGGRTRFATIRLRVLTEPS